MPIKSLKFSLRGLILLTTVIALTTLLWANSLAFQRDLDRLDLIATQMKQLESQLPLNDPVRRSARDAVLDECQATRAVKDRAAQHIDQLAAKYGGVTPRADDVLSIRVVPTLHLSEGLTRVVLRVHVPKQRATWLKFGVTQGDKYGFSRVADEDLVTQSPFSHTGPFERSLESGEHLVVVSHGDAVDGKLPVRVWLANQSLVESVYQSPKLEHAGFSSIGAGQQIDIAPKRSLPKLIDVRVNLGQKGPAHVVRIWLDDQSSGFAGFPGGATLDGGGQR